MTNSSKGRILDRFIKIFIFKARKKTNHFGVLKYVEMICFFAATKKMNNFCFYKSIIYYFASD